MLYHAILIHAGTVETKSYRTEAERDAAAAALFADYVTGAKCLPDSTVLTADVILEQGGTGLKVVYHYAE